MEESIHLDYKGAGSLAKISQKRDEIIKDVTAFANSDGGVIIYGVAEYGDAARKHLPESIDPINRSEFSKEWLEQVISNASPRIHELRIHPVPIPGEETKCLYVVEIPKGETAHQAPDCKYYRRGNFESVPMRDHEVRDVMNRIRVPKIQVEAYLGIRNPWEESSLLFKVTNISNRIALHYSLSVRMPLSLDGILTNPKGNEFVLDKDDLGHFFGFSLGNGKLKSPLFPQASVHLFKELDCHLKSITMKNGEAIILRNMINVSVYADEMTPLHLEFDPKQIRNDWGNPL